MKPITRYVLIPVIAVATLAAGACKGRDANKVDDALNNDLSLASQARQANGMDTVSAAERTATTKTTTTTTSSTPVRHTTTHRSSSSSGTYSNAGTRSGPIDHVEKHGGRDAAIGAGGWGNFGGRPPVRTRSKGALLAPPPVESLGL